MLVLRDQPKLTPRCGSGCLVRQRFPNYTPAEVASYLKDNAVQREGPDPNNTWGHGFALLPTPPGGCAAFAPAGGRL